MKLETMKLETILVHAGAERDPATGAVAPPLHLSTTYEHTPEGGLPHGFRYGREGQPTEARLETALAAVEGGTASFFFASGMAAGAAVLHTLPAGAHVIVPDDLYHGFRKLVREVLPRWGGTSTVVDMTDLDAARAATRPETKLIWAETPSNPLLKVVDLAALATIAHDAGARLVVDSTFATPVLQRPLELGADVVVHSATKYFGGHSDAMGGVVTLGEREPWGSALVEHRTTLGAVASPWSAWLVLRGLRSLACRVERHAASALAVAEALARHPGVSTVHYPGLPSHPGHEVARRQMRAFGGMVSFEAAGGREAALTVASRVRLFTNATSLGGVESLIEHRASIEGPGTTTPQGLLRLSIGLEDPDDLIADLESALG